MLQTTQTKHGLNGDISRAHVGPAQAFVRSVAVLDDKTRLQRQIDATDQEIDRLVYDLYGLTEEEIKIVEAASVASLSKVKENDGYESETDTSADRISRKPNAQVASVGASRHDDPGEGDGGLTGKCCWSGSRQSMTFENQPVSMDRLQDPDGESQDSPQAS